MFVYFQGKWLFGHPGYGGSTVLLDPEEELVVVYITNGLKTGMGQLSRYFHIFLRDFIFLGINL
jgi:CubicO group peptidase (beta-lactamase class C family)